MVARVAAQWQWWQRLPLLRAHVHIRRWWACKTTPDWQLPVGHAIPHEHGSKDDDLRSLSPTTTMTTVQGLYVMGDFENLWFCTGCFGSWFSILFFFCFEKYFRWQVSLRSCQLKSYFVGDHLSLVIYESRFSLVADRPLVNMYYFHWP